METTAASTITVAALPNFAPRLLLDHTGLAAGREDLAPTGNAADIVHLTMPTLLGEVDSAGWWAEAVPPSRWR